jgi:pimeloyl-ACP methyl ester carboxylesterase
MTWALRVGFRGLSAIAPGLAARIAVRLWFRIPKVRISDDARAALATGERSVVMVNGRRVVVWRWGGGTGPAVILMHGWGGSGAQFHAVIEALTRRGMTAVTFDALSHGQSDPGALGARSATLFEFGDALREVARATPDVIGIVAHSGGCAATAWALMNDERWTVPRLVFVAPFAHPSRYIDLFQRTLGLSDAAIARFRADSESQFGFQWKELEVPEIAARIHTPPVLVIHDTGDRETSWQDGADVAASWPGATLLSTTGLGHNRILRDSSVVDAIADFLQGE